MRDSRKSRLLLFRSPLASKPAVRSQSPTESTQGLYKDETRDIPYLDLPSQEESTFLRHEESTTLELFYDLFLTANLTVFTSVHEVRDLDTLKQYIGFFCILWFTWYQVGLYDVRFSMDSVFERMAKAAQFLVMMGFAVVGPKFNPGEESGDEQPPEVATVPSLKYFKALTMILMASRLVLALQYLLQAILMTRKDKPKSLPITLIATTYFVAALAYFGIFFAFNGNGPRHLYIVWYVTANLETVIATAISSVWRDISFKGTHLVQRMSLLTLIILGEGVIGVASKVQRIVQSEGALRFTASTVGNIICAVLVLYFIYMIYFDWVEEEHFGTIRQQVWSFLHFPLHLSLVLAVEGVSQCITWWAGVVRGKAFAQEYELWTSLAGAGEYADVAKQVNQTSNYLIFRGLLTSSTVEQTLEMLTYDLKNAGNASQIIANGAEDPVLAQDALYWIYFTLYKTIFNIAGFDSPVIRAEVYDLDPEASPFATGVDFADEDDARDAVESITATAGVFDLTYIYFFISLGMVIILCCVIAAISKRRKSKLHWARLLNSVVIGLGLCLLSTAHMTGPGREFSFSPWLLPTATIALAVVVVLNSVKPAFPRVVPFARGEGGLGAMSRRESI